MEANIISSKLKEVTSPAINLLASGRLLMGKVYVVFVGKWRCSTDPKGTHLGSKGGAVERILNLQDSKIGI